MEPSDSIGSFGWDRTRDHDIIPLPYAGMYRVLNLVQQNSATIAVVQWPLRTVRIMNQH